MNRRIIINYILPCLVFLSTNLFAKANLSDFIEVTDKNKVCMVNDFYNPIADFTEFMVIVEKKRYYGCCAMCKKKLRMSINHRTAIDPLSKESVSKADAFIIAEKHNKGRTLYFKSKSNFLKWVKL